MSSGQFCIPALQKTLLLFESFKNKADKEIRLQNILGTKAHGANKMYVPLRGLV